MMPPVRDQADIGQIDVLTDASKGDTARQEFKEESDINYMLSRFGITQPRGTPTYGEWDDSIDLQMALESVREAREGFNRLPKELRDKFPRMEDILRAVDNGSLVIKDEPAPEPTKTPEQVIQERLDALERAQPPKTTG